MINTQASPKKMYIYGWFICSLAALFYAFEYLLRIEPSIMVAPLMHAFHIHAVLFGLMVSAYYVAYTPLQLVVGSLTDYVGPKRIMTAAIALCVLGCVFFGQGASYTLALLGRFLMGAGSAFAFIGILKLSAMWLPRRFFSLFAGIATSIGMLGAVYGNIGMTHVVQQYNWHQVLKASTWLGLLLVVCFILFVRDKPKDTVQKITFGKSFSGLSRIIRIKQLQVTGLIGCMLFLSLSLFADTWAPFFLEQAHHYTLMAATQLTAFVYWGWLVGAPIFGWFSDYFQMRRQPLILGASVAAVCMVVLLLSPQMPHSLLVICLFCFGFFSSSEVVVFAIARDLAPCEQVASFVGWVNTLVMLGGMLVQPVVGLLLHLMWRGVTLNHVRVYGIQGYTVALSLLPVLMLLAAGAAYFMKETHGQHLRIPKRG